MANKEFNTRITHKHDTESNWITATTFIPLAGELIIYDPDAIYDYMRVKIGDGVHTVDALPFLNETLETVNPGEYVIKEWINLKFENEFKSAILETVYPVGSIYVSVNSTSPATLFSLGEWERIEDTFLLASGSTYTAGTTGGEATHTLTVEEMPAHTHDYKRHAFDRNDTDPETGEDVYGANNKTLAAHTGTTASVGGGVAHNNMPPYLAVYVWKRVA